MPFIKNSNRAERLKALLSDFERYFTWLAALAGVMALVALIGSGEWMAAWFPGQIPVVRSLVRGLHLVAGWLVALWVLWRGVALLLRWGQWIRHWGQSSAPGEAGVNKEEEAAKPVALAVAEAAFWVMLALMVLSGLERYLRLRHGWGLLPLNPAIWWPFHRALRPFLYAVMLVILVNHGKILVKRTLLYLQAP